jgi:hypothetical protein
VDGKPSQLLASQLWPILIATQRIEGWPQDEEAELLPLLQPGRRSMVARAMPLSSKSAVNVNYCGKGTFVLASDRGYPRVRRIASEPWLGSKALIAFHDCADYFPGVCVFVDGLLSGSDWQVAAQAGSMKLFPRQHRLEDAVAIVTPTHCLGNSSHGSRHPCGREWHPHRLNKDWRVVRACPLALQVVLGARTFGCTERSPGTV